MDAPLFHEDCCVICKVKGDVDIATVTWRGLPSLVDASLQRNDAELHAYLTAIPTLQDPPCVLVHKQCRRQYTSAFYINQQKTGPCGRLGSPIKKRKLRSDSNNFDWKTDCMFCDTPVNFDSTHPDRRDGFCVRTLAFRENVIAICNKRCDEWGVKVKCRIQDCHDLVAAEAVYHKNCHALFVSSKQRASNHTAKKGSFNRGRPQSTSRSSAFESLCDWLERCPDTVLFTLQDLHKKMVEIASYEEVYTEKWLKKKLLMKYGEHITFAEVDGKPNVICFRNMASYIISDKWYSEKSENTEEEKRRIIIAAAKMIVADIRCHQKSDTYPKPSQVRNTNELSDFLPPSLQTLLEYLVPSKLKQCSVGHVIMQAAMPRTVLSPLLLGIGVEMDHMFGSRWLITELSALGFSVSYGEVTKYKQSVLESSDCDVLPPNPTLPVFAQWSADNVDHNICTLDGKGTFHGMGIMRSSIYHHDYDADTSMDIPIKRPSTVKKVGDIVKHCGVNIVRMDAAGIPPPTLLKPFINLQIPYVLPQSVHFDLLWHAGLKCSITEKARPNWSGFMKSYSKGGPTTKQSEITLLPLVNLNPSDETCIYSTLAYIENQAQKLNILTPCVTFDQPLWIKAVDVIKKMGMGIVCRLGGFHMLMSFMGSIGFVMAASGLSEALNTIYGANTVTHMMSGKEFARALRGHLLTQAALMSQIISRIVPLSEVPSEVPSDNVDAPIIRLTTTEFHELQVLYNKVVNLESIEDVNILNNFEQCIKCCKDVLSAASKTARLWIQYISYIEIIQLFIRAEREGDWNLHLVAVSKMLPLFAATGHNMYAKCGRLYLQMMLELPFTHPWLYEQFHSNGHHVIHRTHEYWTGLSTDLAIEQCMMRVLKSRGGLTHGRGMTDNTCETWIHSMHMCGAMHNAMTVLTGSEHHQSTQHSEMFPSRVERDNKDLAKLVEWFNGHPPFSLTDSLLRNVATGITASEKDDVNCDEADAIGWSIHEQLDGKAFQDVKLKKKDQVKTLRSLLKGVKVGKETVHIENSTLFWRLTTLVEREGNSASYFEFELTATPTSLFTDRYMRKSAKAALAHALTKGIQYLPATSRGRFVLDGGCLLHRMSWPKKCTWRTILGLYSQYIQRHYGNCCVVVFDGYASGPSTKDHEHLRRGLYSSAPDIQISADMPVYENQHSFLSNSKNVHNLIAALEEELVCHGHTVHKADSDADTLIVSSVLELSSDGTQVTVVSDDTDILVLLVYHVTDEMGQVYMQNVAKGRTQTNPTVHNIQQLRHHVGPHITRHILFIHAMSGCDTTSSPFKQGKVKVLKCIAKSSVARDSAEIFLDMEATSAMISTAGQQFLVSLYGGTSNETLTQLRFHTYMRMTATVARPLPELLPPSIRAAHYHCLRVYLQVRQWNTLSVQGTDPLLWGWSLNGQQLEPITTDIAPAPDCILNIVRCNCKVPGLNQCSTNICSCRKHGLTCVAACGNCHSNGCANSGDLVWLGDADDDCDDINSIEA